MGTLVYGVYCWITVKNSLAFVTVQDAYGRHLQWPWVGLWQGITALLFGQPFGSVLEMFPAFITLALLGIRHPRLHQALLIIFPALLATLSIIFMMNRWLV